MVQSLNPGLRSFGFDLIASHKLTPSPATGALIFRFPSLSIACTNNISGGVAW